jgi:hypothetical protein
MPRPRLPPPSRSTERLHGRNRVVERRARASFLAPTRTRRARVASGSSCARRRPLA